MADHTVCTADDNSNALERSWQCVGLECTHGRLTTHGGAQRRPFGSWAKRGAATNGFLVGDYFHHVALR